MKKLLLLALLGAAGYLGWSQMQKKKVTDDELWTQAAQAADLR